MSEWQTIDSCPSNGDMVWTAGHPGSSNPLLRMADGEWWRANAKIGVDGPTHWAPCRPPAWPPTTGQEGE